MSLRERYTEYERRRTAKFSRRLPRWRTRRHRRRLAVAWSLFPVFLVVVLLTDLRGTGWFLPLWLALYAGWLSVWGLLRVLTAALVETLSPSLDERQRELRDRAIFLGYQFGLLTLLPLLAYLLLNQRSPDLGINASILLAIAFVVLAAAPTALLAWVLPDDHPEDFQDQ
ncbi:MULTISPECIES: hypothetical protein [unclassified Crossiella]|uniref:hypothetical protein n=1 Tax=unclassified Crossiella TaxID=2620835 RepID=UPI001FFEE487|nr:MULTISPECIES: hypothetical protein [unclassified Crossiella]MCK2244070.1 hypothetical protein [Crossiella sp. S99.2]MCK2257072.1 hypothetical protein [Crossiella sp. S99.1]